MLQPVATTDKFKGTVLNPPGELQEGARKLGLHLRCLNDGYHWQFRHLDETGPLVADYWPSAMKLKVRNEVAIQPVPDRDLLAQLAVVLISLGLEKQEFAVEPEPKVRITPAPESNVDVSKMWAAVLAVTSGSPKAPIEEVIARAEDTVRAFENWLKGR